MVIFVLDYLKV